MRNLREVQKTLTEKENQVVECLIIVLANWIGGEDFSDYDISDIAKDLNMTKPEVKGIVGSLVKKDVLVMWDGCIMFRNQAEMIKE